jgi:hypothetical protein
MTYYNYPLFLQICDGDSHGNNISITTQLSAGVFQDFTLKILKEPSKNQKTGNFYQKIRLKPVLKI